MKSRYFIAILLLALCTFTSCREDMLSNDPTLRITFSHDTVHFDTVFTATSSSTKKLMVYNPNKNAIAIQQIAMKDGRYFRINVDGENNLDYLKDITIRGGDSLFIFIRTDIDQQNSHTPVLLEDDILFVLTQHTQQVTLQAYGQDVQRMQSKEKIQVFDRFTFTNHKPYHIFDTILVKGLLSIQAGATLYMHQGACIYAYGSIYAKGTLEQPIIIRGDRTDNLFDSVPYSVASEQWDGIYLIHPQNAPQANYQLHYVDILSASVGLYAYSENTTQRPKLQLYNARIHNHSLYGLVLQNIDATVVNTEITNCASYCIYIAGGKQQFIHNTIAAYFGYPYTSINIHNDMFPNTVAAVYINNLSKNTAPTDASFYNCIITGAEKNNLVLATPLPKFYPGHFVGNFLQTDSITIDNAQRNVYTTTADSLVFRNIHYSVDDYRYYDFQLDTLSPARGIADSLIALEYPFDRLGNPRKPHPDAGCYEFTK